MKARPIEGLDCVTVVTHESDASTAEDEHIKRELGDLPKKHRQLHHNVAGGTILKVL
jgi:hypothetical protein